MGIYLENQNIRLTIVTAIHFKIRKIREIKSFTQEYLAIELGVSTKTYSRIETGETKLSVERLEQIANIFELEVTDILNFSPSLVFVNKKSINSK